MNIEDRIANLEASLRSELASLRAGIEKAFAGEASWCERYWDYVAIAAFAVGILVGAVA